MCLKFILVIKLAPYRASSKLRAHDIKYGLFSRVGIGIPLSSE